MFESELFETVLDGLKQNSFTEILSVVFTVGIIGALRRREHLHRWSRAESSSIQRLKENLQDYSATYLRAIKNEDLSLEGVCEETKEFQSFLFTWAHETTLIFTLGAGKNIDLMFRLGNYISYVTGAIIHDATDKLRPDYDGEETLRDAFKKYVQKIEECIRLTQRMQNESLEIDGLTDLKPDTLVILWGFRRGDAKRLF